jgi:hypothetical protein
MSQGPSLNFHFGLRTREPSLKLWPEAKRLINVDADSLTGVRYKALDDLLARIFCAYLGYHFWHWDLKGFLDIGDADARSLVLPIKHAAEESGWLPVIVSIPGAGEFGKACHVIG